MAEPVNAKCFACGALQRSAFCSRCWRLADRSMRYELGWWHGEFRAATTHEEAAFALACWNVVAAWIAGHVREALERRAAAKLLKKTGRKRPKTLAELALEEEERELRA